MKEGNRRKELLRKLLCIITVIMMIAAMALMSACSKARSAEADYEDQVNSTEEGDDDSVKAADPMTEEELEDYTGGGCVGESADSYY